MFICVSDRAEWEMQAAPVRPRSARKPRTRTALVLLLPVAIAAVLLVAWPRTTEFSQLGLTFDVPSGWTIRGDLAKGFGPGQTLALIGTRPWGSCGPSDINCHYQQVFAPNAIEVAIEFGSLRGTDICSLARDRLEDPPADAGVHAETNFLRIDGRPAIVHRVTLDTPSETLPDGARTWQIAAVGTTKMAYGISATWRGPEAQPLLDALDRLVASVRLGPSGFASVPSDCGDPFPPSASGPVPTVLASPTPEPEARLDSHGDAGPRPSMLAEDPCPAAIAAVEEAANAIALPADRIVLEPGPFYCDLIWPGGQSAGPCVGPNVRPGQYMHGWVWFRGSDQVAAVMLGLDLPDALDQPGATRPPWHATLVATEVPPAGFVVQ